MDNAKRTQKTISRDESRSRKGVRLLGEDERVRMRGNVNGEKERLNGVAPNPPLFSRMGLTVSQTRELGMKLKDCGTDDTYATEVSIEN